MRPDCIILVGHSAASQGAVGVDGVSEYEYHRKLAPEVVHSLYGRGHDAESRWRPEGLKGNKGLNVMLDSINLIGPKCLIELHFNAGAPNRCGVEVLHWPGSGGGASLAAHLLREVAPAWSALDGAAHRVVPQSRSWNGPAMTDSSGRPVPGGPELDVLRRSRMPAVILETHYGSHERSVQLAHELSRSGKLADAIAAGVSSWLQTQR
jgi:N-acetylmuramoyl-L-alanine amidase